MITNWLVLYGFKIIVALFIFLIGKKIAKLLTNWSIKAMAKSSAVDETLEKFLKSVIYGVLMAVVILSALSQAGIETTSFVAILGAVGLAIGLAFKDTLSNISAGVMIIIFAPIKIGEFVEAGGESGTVEEINIFNTVLKTGDNKMIIIGNSKVIANNIVNYSRKATRRVDLVFGISYDDNIKVAKDIILDVLNSDSRIINDPAVPFVAVKELGDNSVNIVSRAWVNSADYWAVYFDSLENVKIKFDEAGITIPFPQMQIHNQA